MSLGNEFRKFRRISVLSSSGPNSPRRVAICIALVEDEGTKIFRIFENYPTTQRHVSEGFNLQQQHN